MRLITSTTTAFNFNSGDTLPFCKGCIKGKQSRQPVSKTPVPRTTGLLQLVHSDVCGPMQTPSLLGAIYFVTFTDDYSRYTVVYPIKAKSEVFAKFQDYRKAIKNQFGKPIRALRSDNGGEYISKRFKAYLAQKGIQHQLTAPHTLEHNGVAECKNRTLVKMARCMLQSASMPNIFWIVDRVGSR